MTKELPPEIKKARTELVLKYPFFGKLALGLEFFETKSKAEGGITDTMGTDGKTIAYNKEFIGSLTHAELVGVIAHEILHVVFKHHIRRCKGKVRCPEFWNIAGDFVINDVLLDAGFTLPEGGCIDDQYQGMSTEEVYELIYNPFGDTEDEENISISNPEWGEVFDAKNQDGTSLSDADIKTLERELNIEVLQAEQSSKSQSKTGNALQGVLKSYKEDKTSWEDVLSDLVMDKTEDDDYNFNNANKRFIYQDLYLPSIEKKPYINVCLTVDSSGSVSNKERSQYIDCINNIFQTVNPDKVTVIYCDYVIRQVDTFDKGEFVELPDKDSRIWFGGGTDYTPVFEYIENDLDDSISYLVYLTDGYCIHSHIKEPDYPVIWATTGTKKYFKFGDVVDIE